MLAAYRMISKTVQVLTTSLFIHSIQVCYFWLFNR